MRYQQFIKSVFICVHLWFIGCVCKPQDPAATQPATVADVATTQPAYWYDQPATVEVTASNLDTLVDVSLSVMRQFGFTVDRVDYRAALITSRPLISSQFFEFWKSDVASADDSFEASARTTRRTLRFEITKLNDGEFELTPKVLVERQSVAEKRITNSALYRGAFTRASPQQRPRGTKESDEGVNLPSRYWFAEGRDPALEKKLASAIEKQLSRSAQSGE